MIDRLQLFNRDKQKLEEQLSQIIREPVQNAQTAAEKALVEGYLYIITNEHRNARNLLEAARKAFLDLDQKLLAADADRLYGFSTLNTGDHVETYARLTRALHSYETLNEQMGVARTMNWLVSHYFQTGEYLHALDIAESAVEHGERFDDPLPVANLTGNIGNLYLRIADHDKALTWYQRALEKHRSLGNNFGVAAMTGNIGAVYSAYADFTSALEWYRKALNLYEEQGNKTEIARTLGNIANAYANTGDLVAAFEWERKALLIAEDTGDKRGIARITGNLGMRYFRTGNLDDAVLWMKKAIDIYDSIGDRRGVTHISGILGEVYIKKGETQLATETLERTLQHAQELSLPIEIAEAALHLVTLSIDKQEDDLAEYYLAIGNDNAKQADTPRLNIRRDFVLAKLYQYQGKIELAKEMLNNAVEESERLGLIELRKDAHDVYYQIEKKNQDYKSALEHIEANIALRDQLLGEQQQRRIAMLEVEHSVEDDRKRAEEQRAQNERQLQLLSALLPASVAKRLLEGETRIADSHENVSVMFLDLVGFTNKASQATPQELINMLDLVFSTCGAVAKKYSITTIKTIGDAYMAVCGAPDEYEDHALRAGKAAAAIIQALPNLSFRIGLHCGPLIAGVIDAERIAYDVWGDSVNIAARMEQSSEPNRIHVSDAFAKALDKYPDQGLVTEYRGEISIKGKGLMHTYWLRATEPLP